MMYGIKSRGIWCAFLCLAKAGKVKFERDGKFGNVLEKQVKISHSGYLISMLCSGHCKSGLFQFKEVLGQT